MSTDTGLDMDMHTALQWPGRVRIRIHIEHLQGPAEECRLTLNRSAVPRVVAVGLDPKPAPGAGGRHLQWQELPGRTLRQRSLAAVATWLFDSVKMAPRICGLPMYRAVSLTMAAEGHELRATQVQVLIEGGDLAEADRMITLLEEANPESLTTLNLRRRLVGARPMMASNDTRRR